MTDALGWVATAIVVGSYFFRDPAILRRIQALGAVLWLGYGAIIHSPPVIVANLVVAGVALWSSLRAPEKVVDT